MEKIKNLCKIMNWLGHWVQVKTKRCPKMFLAASLLSTSSFVVSNRE